MHRLCSREVFVSAPELELGQRSLPVSKAGIGTYTSFSHAYSQTNLNLHRFLIWIGSDQEKTFGRTISNLIHDNIEPERMILWDTKKRGGRPDTMKLLKDTWISFKAEAVFITSNMQGNDEMMQGCMAGTLTYFPTHLKSAQTKFLFLAGIHAFGTLWDF